MPPAEAYGYYRTRALADTQNLFLGIRIENSIVTFYLMIIQMR